MADDPRPDDDPETFEDDPETSEGEAPQAMNLFTEQTEPDVRLDPNNPAFDRVQQGKTIDDEYEAEYNRRYVKEHGDHHGNKPTEGPKADRP